MASGDERHGKEPAAAPAEDKFPVGMRVLAVDDDRVCLKLLEAQLRRCKFNPTMVSDARTALNMLREGGEEQFDLVITDVHMPDMDGFKLLELIGLEMDLPVIMLSVNGERETVYKGITHGACDYLVKPVHIKELKNIWQHVARKNPSLLNYNSSDSDDADQGVMQPVVAEGEQGGRESKKCSKKKRHDGDDYDENIESTSVRTTRKKPRVSWNGELHSRFLDVVDLLGVDRAVPKTILQMMNVKNLTRESVASHLQKYRLYLKRVADDPSLLGESSERRNPTFYIHMNRKGTMCHHHGVQPSAAIGLPCSVNPYAEAPAVLGPHGLSLEPRNRAMGTTVNGGSMSSHAELGLPDTTRRRTSAPPVINSVTNISSDQTMLDAFPSTNSTEAYAGVLREKLLEACSVVPSSHPSNSSSSLAEMANGGPSGPVNQLPVQRPESVSRFSGLMMNTAPSAVGARRDAQLPYLVGISSNLWQNVESSSFPAHTDGTPLAQSQVNIPQMNQMPSFGASASPMPMFQNEEQNQMAGGIIINNNNTSVGVFSEQMTPLFNMASNTAPEEMRNGNFSPMTEMMANGGSTSSVAPPVQMVNGASSSPASPDLQNSSLVPTQVLNAGDASGILPVQDNPADQQAPYDPPTYSSPFFLEEIFSSMVNNQDFNDDLIFGGEY